MIVACFYLYLWLIKTICLTLKQHTQSLSWNIHFHTGVLRHIITPWPPLLLRLLSSRILTMPMHSSMALWPATFISCMQCAQNSLSHVVLPHHPGSASSRLSHLCWLPVHRRIQYKIALLAYKRLSTNQPPYLRNLLHMYQPSRCLRSASQNLLSVLFCTTNFSQRSFSFTAPTIWNELPAVIRESNTGHLYTPIKNSPHLSNYPQHTRQLPAPRIRLDTSTTVCVLQILLLIDWLCYFQVSPGSLTVLSIMGKVEDVNKVTGQLTLL